LAPQLRPGDILIMDNLKAHKSETALKAVQSRQAEVNTPPAEAGGIG